jgi:arylsulfatase
MKQIIFLSIVFILLLTVAGWGQNDGKSDFEMFCPGCHPQGGNPLNPAKTLRKMSNDEVIEYLTVIKGVGRWTVEMLLMFALGREDVFAVDDLGIGNNTIVLYTTDNGPHQNSWPDAGTTPFRSEKNTNWEGAFRVPCLIRWPGRIQPGSISNDIVSGLDWLPTLMAAAGDPDIKDKLLKGHQAGSKTFKVHLDGYNQLPYLTGQQPKSARTEFIYFNDDGDLVCMRYENWKVVFEEQRAQGTLRIWAEPFTPLRVPKLFNLRTDPFERADHEAADYGRWRVDHAFVLVPAQGFVARHLATYKDFPPRQKPGSFSLDQVLEALQSAPKTGN